ncbi:pigment-dispersing hormone peptides-like [Athalia rosae]|uniref:pigment-dispersing hormone peptides-like n=1 Tax=Athalia rosae TaxID=37344 RepID=UPI000A0EDDDB|nr:pigment-dispersing hormone peptides-like [Athalia rosae]
MHLIACCFAVTVFGVVLGHGLHVEGAPVETMQQDSALTSLIRYSRGLDKELQLAKFLLTRQGILNSNGKRNSELINSLLGLPKNINKIGK